MSVAGDGLMARMRTAWFGALGMTTAVGLGLVAFVLNQGLPSIQELPFPNAPIESGDDLREPVSPTVSLPPTRPARDRRSSPARAEPTQPGPRTPTDAKLVEAQKTEAAPAPEPIPNAPPPPPPSGGQGSNPQASQPPQPQPAAPAPDSQEDEDEEEEAKEMGDHAEKHAGKSDRGHQ